MIHYILSEQKNVNWILKTSLIDQIVALYNTNKFDYLLIEASGICEPIPIAQTIVAINDMLASQHMGPIVRLDAVITVADALRLTNEFECGNTLVNQEHEEEDIEEKLKDLNKEDTK